MSRWTKQLTMAAVLSTGACASCAWGYTQVDGTRRIIGFVDLEIRPAADPRTVAGEVIDVRTIGLSLLDAGDGTSVVLGWQRTIVAALRDNALVLGNPLTATGDTENDDNEKGVDNEN